MNLRSLVVPWPAMTLGFVVAVVLGAVIGRVTQGTWGSHFDPVFLLCFAIGWFGVALVTRYLAGRSERTGGP